MQRDPHARLIQKGRLRPVTQHLEHDPSFAELAAENGYRCAEACAATNAALACPLPRRRSILLADRRSLRRPQRRMLDPQQLQQPWISATIGTSPGSCGHPPSP
jgi:hypothetical protein